VSRTAYVDGQYLPHRAAAVHIEDRGYQFADGVYEVIAVVGGRLLDEEPTSPGSPDRWPNCKLRRQWRMRRCGS
jgi:hypothetical protein